MDNERDYIIIENRDNTTGLFEFDNNIVIKHFFGVQSENFILMRGSKRLKFSIIKLNGSFYINLNGEHIIEYTKFISISYLNNIDNNVKIKSKYFGELIIENCDIHLVTKSIEIITRELKNRYKWYKELFFFLIQ
jgi:hypothetical protein